MIYMHVCTYIYVPAAEGGLDWEWLAAEGGLDIHMIYMHGTYIYLAAEGGLDWEWLMAKDLLMVATKSENIFSYMYA